MKNFYFTPSLSLAFACLFCTGLMAGCGIGVVDTSVSAVQANGSAGLQGSVYGGHAPIVGAEVFVLTPGVTGYYSKATDITTNTSLPTDSTFGYHYVTTANGGFFNISGDYACTPNYPVFLAAYGGNPITVPPVTITAEAISGTGPYTVKFTNQGYGLLYQGETVTISGLTGSWAYLNGTQTVLGDANLTSTSFDIQVSSNGGNATGSYSVSGLVAQATTSVNSNPGIVNLAVLGLCPASGSTNFAGVIPFVYMNEVSTVAAGYALAGFQSGSWYNIGIPAPGSDALALQGIQNAALTAGNLYDITGGNLGTATDGPDTHIARSTTAAGNGTVPQYLLNAMANILANCVDSSNTSSTSSTQCSLLFGYAKSAGTSGTTPTDIATAIFNMAHNPSANVTSLFNLPTGNVPFLPQLGSTPNDFSVGISYSGGGLNGPFYSAVDGSGNIWVGNQGGQVGTTISEFSPLGAALSGTLGFSGGGLIDPYGIAIDVSGNVWTSNYSASTLSEFNSSGTAISPATGYTGGNLNFPYQLAFDKNGNLWVPGYGQPGSVTTASLSEFSSTGTSLNTYYGGSMSRPRMLAINNSTIYIANQNGPLSEFNLSTATFNTALTGGGLNADTGVALDSSGDIWLVNDGNSTLSEFTSAGATLSPTTGYTGGGLNNSAYLAIDGANNVFATNISGNSISEFNNAGTPITNASGFVATTNSGGSPLNNAQDIVLDSSGNAWVVNFGNNRLVEYVGIAAPVVTPVISCLIQGKYGKKP